MLPIRSKIIFCAYDALCAERDDFAMNTLISILIAVLIFFVIVVIHEFGHFIVARMNDIPVSEFAIGMGPIIFKKQMKETLFTIRAFPIGGFCSMGEDEEDTDGTGFRSKPVYRRIPVIVAGAFMNLLLGLVLSFIIVPISGKVITTEVVNITEDSDFEASGIKVGDKIVKVNGLHIFTANDIVYQLCTDEDGYIDFVVERNGEKLSFDGVKFDIAVDEETGSRVLTYDFKVLSRELTLRDIVPEAFSKWAYNARLILMSLRDMVLGKYGINDLSGPVGIVTVISEAAEESGFDIEYLLEMALLITVNVGIFNLIPFPALDGGRLVFLIIEAIRRKPIKAETEGMIHFAGLVLILGLGIVVTCKDVINVFN